ncbi:recombination associated protein [gamma proteobacterium HTCC5015]|nr:recombination associated protein [gamma proteobacterium HTCC5015]
MLFRNLQLYRFTAEFSHSTEALERQLSAQAFQACAKNQTHSQGWVSPLGKHGEQRVHAANGYMMLCLRKEERLVPAAVLREALEEKVEAIELSEHRPVRGKEKARIKDELLLDMLPRAFTRSRYTYAYIAPSSGWLVVDSSSPARAEELLSALRESLGGLPVLPLQVRNAPHSVFTHWLKQGHVEAGFELGERCELHGVQEQEGVIQIRRQSLDNEEIQVHIEAGKVVTKLALEFQNRLSFVLDDALSVKQLRFSDEVLESLEEDSTDSFAAEFDARFARMTLELEALFPELLKAFGGEVEE